MDREVAPTQDEARHALELLELGDAFFELDRDWRIVRVNANQEKLSGKPRSETLGRSFWDVWPDAATPDALYWREYHRCMEERVPVQFQDYYAPLTLWTGVTAYPISTGGIAVFFRDITAMKQAEQDRIRLAAIVEDTDDAIISKSLDGTITTWNGGAERLFGYTADEAIGRPIRLLIPGDRLDEEDRIMAELRAGGHVSHYETTRLRKDGTRVEVSVTVSPLRDEKGTIVGASKIARDITGRKRAEEALLRTEEQFRSVVENMSEGLMLFDVNGDLIYQNPASLRIHGFQPDAHGRIQHDRLPVTWNAWDEQGRPIGFDAWPVSRVFRRERFQNQILRVERVETGRVFHGSYNGSPILDADGRLVLGFITIRDISEQIRAEEALRDAGRQYRSLAENAPEVIARFDRQLRHTYVNQYGAEVYGIPAHEVLGKTNAELGMPADKVEFWRRHFEAVLATGEQRTVDFDFESPRLGERRFSSLFVPERGAGGEVVSILAITRDVTERRRAEIAVRESEAKFRSVFEQAAIGMGRVRFSDARWIDVNDAFCRMLGRSREEMLATPWPDLTHPDDLARDLVPFRQMAAGELDSYSVEKRFLHEDGHFVWARLTLSLVRDAAGRPDYEIAIIEDVTAEKRAEEEVRAAGRAAEHERRRLATILETLPAGVAIADAAGAFTDVNSEFKRIWGTPPSPRSVNEYGAWRGWWPDGRPIATDQWALPRALMTGEVIVPGDVVDIEKFDGSGRATIINAAAPIRNAEGEIVGGVLTEVDISVQRRAEAAARAAEQRMRSVVENLPSGLVVADLQTGDLHWNAEALRIHGYTGEGDEHRFLESLVAEHDLRTLAGEPIPVSRWPLPRLLAREEFREYELRVRNTRLGWERVFSYSGVVVQLPGAPALGLLAIRDVSARSRAEAAVREANERLVEADRRKDEFLGMLSHELRNPLAPIRNALFILDHAAPEGQQARRAKDIATRQVTHLTRLVDDLLDVTRIARGKIELRNEELDLGALVRRTAEDYRPLMQDRGLDLALDVPHDPVLIRGDPARLTQVFGNLLNNAAKFTPAGGRVALSLRPEGDRAVAHVADTGPGIAPDLLPSLFEPFTQGKQTLARSEGGLGLGLSLVKGLVALHGGEVAVSSRPGAGADFAVALALSRPPTRPSAGVHAAAPDASSAGHRHRVLVVDDNRDAAESLGELVRMLGHEVELAYDGPTAVAQASKTRPDLVLCDIGLPGMDGYQVARELRARQDGGDLRLVALSGYAQPEDVARALDAGFDSHVAKPADPSRLEGLLT